MALPITRHSALLYAAPRWFIEGGEWDRFDYHEWAADVFEWERDPGGLWRDRASYPSDTITTGRGDCDDYAVVALNYLWHTTERPLAVAITTRRVGGIMPQHVLVFDGERTHDSRYGVREWSLDAFLADSDDVHLLRRRVR